MLNRSVLVSLLALASFGIGAVAMATTTATATTMMPGSDRDAHGCIGSAGYTWCAAKQKCLRSWEEKCVTPDNRACVKTAVQVRDTSIIAAWDAYNSGIKLALQNRITALGAAWDKTVSKDIKTASTQAWTAFTKDSKVARKTLNTAKTISWNKFKNDFKACGKTIVPNTAMQSLDAGL